jgi:predicted DNA binding CopG/RHH family protein
MIKEITKEQAIKLYESKFWENLSYFERAKFQLLTKKLCMPFEVFHEAIEKVLKRPVYTHEFGLNYEGLVRELLEGTPAPSLEEIINMIPEDKRVICII